MSSTVLYRAFAENGDLLYVGISLSAIARMCQHQRNADWWPDVTSLTFERFDSRAEALAAERTAIRKENPRHNVHWKRRPPRKRRPQKNPGKRVIFTLSASHADRLNAIADARGVSPQDVVRDFLRRNLTAWEAA